VVRRLLPPILLGLAVFAALSVVRWLLRPEPPDVPEPVTLVLPEMLGCWELDSGEWVFAATTDSPSARASVAPDSASLALLELPDRVLLLPDSIDEWQRPYTTYRASPVAGDHDPRLRDYLRWFPRADTLWLVWSDRRIRAGLALLGGGDVLEGGGRALIAAPGPDRAGFDGRVSVSAWKVNCATGLREVENDAPRR